MDKIEKALAVVTNERQPSSKADKHSYNVTESSFGSAKGDVVKHSTLSVWAGVLFLTAMLAFGFHQMRDWVRDVHVRLDRVSQDNKLVLEGMDELLARADLLARAVESEAPLPEPSAPKDAEGEKPPEEDLSRRYKIYYRTKDGEDLAQIGDKFGVSKDQLRLWNAIPPASSIIPGQVLVINKSASPEKLEEAAPDTPTPQPAPMVAKAGKPVAPEAEAPEALTDRGPAPQPVPEETTAEAVEGTEKAGDVVEGTETTAEVAEDTETAALPRESDTIAAAAEREETDIAEAPAEEDPRVEFSEELEGGVVHTVRARETLSEIGETYGVPWQVLAANNRILDPETLYEGQKIRISKNEAHTATDPAEELTHTVRAGENLYRIGLKYGVSWELIARSNKMPNGGVLFEGQVLKIPAARGGPERDPVTQTVP